MCSECSSGGVCPHWQKEKVASFDHSSCGIRWSIRATFLICFQFCSIEVKKKAIHNPQANREYKQNRPLESQHLILTWEYTKATSVLRFEGWSYKKHSPQPVECGVHSKPSIINGKYCGLKPVTGGQVRIWRPNPSYSWLFWTSTNLHKDIFSLEAIFLNLPCVHFHYFDLLSLLVIQTRRDCLRTIFSSNWLRLNLAVAQISERGSISIWKDSTFATFSLNFVCC